MTIVRKKKIIRLGSLLLGGGSPVKVQSMTKTLTSDVSATIRQIKRMDGKGCEIIRIAVPDRKSVEALEYILPCTNRPIVADIHFSSALAIEAMERGVHGIRINPGNIGSKSRVQDILKVAKDRNCCVRIGVNSGSLDKKYIGKSGKVTPKALVNSALEFIDFFESQNFYNTKISIKSSSVLDTIEANRILNESTDYPIHLGVTESGTFINGSIRSSIALGVLLSEGIGDTIRVSLSSDPVKEIETAWEILKAIGLRERGITVIACPTCSRKAFDVVKVAGRIERKLSSLKGNLTVAVMGCIVNGPGEASHADIGVAGGKGKSVLFERGRIVRKIASCEIENELIRRALLFGNRKAFNDR